jgi:preprotein translocase subunit YajC
MLTGTAWAQSTGGGAPAPILQIAPLLLIFVVFYFLLIRPQQQKAKEHKEVLDNLKRNDEIITAGGIYGRIIELSEKIVTVEIAPNVRVRVERPQISGLVSDPKKSGGDGKDKEKEKSK